MKKTVIAVLLCTAWASYCLAQTEKGTWTIGAELPGWGGNKYYWRGGLNFDAGYFIAKNWMVGGGIGLQYAATRIGEKSYYLNLKPSIFTRYYLPIKSKRLKFFTHGEVGVNWQHSSMPGGSEGDISPFFKVGGGAEYFISPRFSIEAGVFHHEAFEYHRGYNSFDIKLRYRFGGKKKDKK